MLVNLAGGLVDQGLRVDFLSKTRDFVYRDRLAAGVRLIDCGASGLISSLPATIAYLGRERPDVVLCGKDRAASTMLLARRVGGGNFALVMRHGTTVSARLTGRAPWKRWRALAELRHIHAGSAAVVANSLGVAEDMARFTGLARERINLIRNPVVTGDLGALASQTLEHPWFRADEPPVVLGIGGLRRQKGFDTLLDAFARVRASRVSRLVILGEGRLRGALEARADRLGIRDHVSFAGFDSNPYRYLSRAGLFVLASRWEGSPNVLTEALALGTPVVATDCPSGPAEILADGRVAPLVPVDDVGAMADAMIRTLDAPGDASARIAAASPYTVERCAQSYRGLFMSLVENAG